MPTRCNILSDDMIAVQRHMLAHRILQSKGLLGQGLAPSHIKGLQAHGLVPPHIKALALEKGPAGQSRQHHTTNRRLVVIKSVSHRQDFQQQIVLAKRPPESPHNKEYNRYRCGGDDHSMSTATMTTMRHHQAPPLHLPTFKPAVGCIKADDFMIRCFVARLRSGVTVIKHGRSKFQKISRPYILKLETDRESLTWMAANVDLETYEPSQIHQKSSSSPSPKQRVNLSECREVRLALTPDPENPTFTGSATLREKCDAADANKSFALVFEHRTLDITSITEDQAKMLTEGFSALCYRLHLQRNSQQRQTGYNTDGITMTRRSCRMC